MIHPAHWHLMLNHVPFVATVVAFIAGKSGDAGNDAGCGRIATNVVDV